jgi:hypothetical protein
MTIDLCILVCIGGAIACACYAWGYHEGKQSFRVIDENNDDFAGI